MNPGDAVAIGTSIQADALAGHVTDILLLDVSPLSLDTETLDTSITKLIAGNTTILTKKWQDGGRWPDAIEVKVYQGECWCVTTSLLAFLPH